MHLLHRNTAESGMLTALEPIAQESQRDRDTQALQIGTTVVAASFIGVGLGLSLETDADGVGGTLMGIGTAFAVTSLWVRNQLQAAQSRGEQHDA